MTVMINPEMKIALGTFRRGSMISPAISGPRSRPENAKQIRVKNTTVSVVTVGMREAGSNGVAAPYLNRATVPSTMRSTAGTHVPMAPRLFNQRP
jgi:hypothetical protein